MNEPSADLHISFETWKLANGHLFPRDSDEYRASKEWLGEIKRGYIEVKRRRTEAVRLMALEIENYDRLQSRIARIARARGTITPAKAKNYWVFTKEIFSNSGLRLIYGIQSLREVLRDLNRSFYSTYGSLQKAWSFALVQASLVCLSLASISIKNKIFVALGLIALIGASIYLLIYQEDKRRKFGDRFFIDVFRTGLIGDKCYACCKKTIRRHA